MRAGKGGTYREVPVHPQLRPDLALWINDERPAWKGSARTSALLLNHRGARLGARGADGILGAIADEAHLTDEFTTLSRPGARFRCCHRPVSPLPSEPHVHVIRAYGSSKPWKAFRRAELLGPRPRRFGSGGGRRRE